MRYAINERYITNASVQIIFYINNALGIYIGGDIQIKDKYPQLPEVMNSEI